MRRFGADLVAFAGSSVSCCPAGYSGVFPTPSTPRGGHGPAWPMTDAQVAKFTPFQALELETLIR